jgi:hypothetical protein
MRTLMCVRGPAEKTGALLDVVYQLLVDDKGDEDTII